LKEIVYSFDEFKAKADLSKPLHHHGMYECKDPHDIIHYLTFRIYGISKNGNHIIIFEDKHRIDVSDLPQEYRKSTNALTDLNRYVRDLYHQLVEKYAKPVKSTEGEWKE